MENILSSPESAGQIRSRLAFYTASPLVFDDLAKMLGALRARDELAKLNEALPAKLTRFEDAEIAKITPLLDAFAKTRREQVPFALMLVAKRLKPHWQLINLATKAASNKTATSVAATPYAVAVAMVLDRLEDKRGLLRLASNRTGFWSPRKFWSTSTTPNSLYGSASISLRNPIGDEGWMR